MFSGKQVGNLRKTKGFSLKSSHYRGAHDRRICLVGVHKLPMFVEDFANDFFQNFRNKNEHVGKNHLENPLQKSATCVPLPINLSGPVAFQ